MVFGLLFFAGCATLPERYVSLKEEKEHTIAEVLVKIEDREVIFTGEGHNTAEDHLVQLEVIKHLHDRGKEIVLALEMFPTGVQYYLNEWTSGGLAEDDFKEVYFSGWKMPYEYYADIFRFARDNRISMVGVNTERHIINDVAKEGLGTVSRETMEEIKYEPCGSDPEYSRLLGFMGEIHEDTPQMPHICDAQRLRDSIMAFYISRLHENDGRTIVVLLGAAHAVRIAVPGMMEKHAEADYVILMPASLKELIGREVRQENADYIWY